MEIKKSIKTEKGTVVFEGEITPEEHDFILSVGLNELLAQGALPFHELDEQDISSIVIPTTTKKQ